MSLLKNISRLGGRISSRCFATESENLVEVQIDNKTGVTTVIMNRPPVNSLNHQLLEALQKTLLNLEREKCRGMILTSSSPKVFSAGLDIHELYKPSIDKVRAIWRMLQDVWIKLYSSPYPTVAAINGHSPAGGCLLALSCEYMIIVPKVTIGVNETQLGIVPPRWLQDCMRNVIGERQAEKALIAGRMFTSEEAFDVGLVDEIAADKDEAIAKANEFLASQANLPSLARSTVKLGFRNKTLHRFVNEREADTKTFVDFIFQPNVQQSLEQYMQSLKNK